MKNKRIFLIILTILIIIVVTYFITNNYFKSDIVITETIEGLSKTDENKIKNLVSNDFFRNDRRKCEKLNTELYLNIGSWSSKDNINAVVTCNCTFDEIGHPYPNCIDRRYDIGKIDGVWTIVSSGEVGWE